MPLANTFLRKFAAQAGRNITGFTPAATDCIRGFEWPGNVRQLENEIQRAVLMCQDGEVDVRHLSVAEKNVQRPHHELVGLTPLEAVERHTIVQMLRETGGNKVETSRRLGIGRQTLYNKLRQYNIPL